MTSIKRNSLCAPCQGIFQLKPNNPTVVVGKDYQPSFPPATEKLNMMKHHLSFEEFEDCAKNECHLCLLVWNKIPQDIRRLLRDPTHENGMMSSQYAANQQVSMFDLFVWYPFSARVRVFQNDPGFKTTVHVFPEEPDVTIRTAIPEEILSLNTGSESCLATALTWIHDCVDNHDGCRLQSRSIRTLPSRMVDIGSASDFSDVRLCTTAKLNEEIVYVALSHCWGLKPILRLTKELLKAFEAGITFESLSQTFQHAIKAARYLRQEFRVRYIWIDSLCIVQDDADDWRQEAAKMGQVYKNAFCVLAATSGTDGSSGLFFDRNPLSICPVSLQLDWDGGSKRSYICKDNKSYDTDIFQSPLLRRAWVVQERTLASRVLHFTAQQLYWECAMLEASESYPQGLKQYPHPLLKRWSPHDFKLKRTETYYNPDKSDRDIYKMWDDVLFHYSSAKLTKGSDKLIAISGIAKEMQSHLEGKDTYVAGIWKRDIVYNVLWEVLHTTKNPQNIEYRAPSWSWASLDAPLQLGRSPSDSDRILVVISSIMTTPATDDHFLSVTSGFLRITGFMVKSLLLPGGNRSHNKVKVRPFSKSTMVGIGNTDIDLRLSDTNWDVAWCMPFMSSEASSFNLNAYAQKHLTGLILKPTMNLKGQYERAGVLRVIGEDCCKTFIDLAKSERLEERQYETAEVDSGKYTITIV